jgi:pimeloyl-ACP methyl ester carboxylesterase
LLSLTVQEDQVQLTNGISMQVLSCLPKPQQPPLPRNTDETPAITVLVFLHGSFHGAWCWAEHWLPYFAQHRNCICVAPSWRGTGGTPVVAAGVTKTKIDQHVDDLHSLLEVLPGFVASKLDASLAIHSETNVTAAAIPVVLISHSFGGLVVMKYLERYHVSVKSQPLPPSPPGCSAVGGIVSMCSVPPSGNGRMTSRFLQKSLRNSWKITRGLALKQCCTDVTLCRELFFQGSDNETDQEPLSDAEIERYQGYFARDSVATIDLLDLARKLPSAQTLPDTGQASFLAAQDQAAKLPCLVLGARHDFIVDGKGLEETARYYFGTTLEPDALVVVDSPHDVMLGPQWKNAALALDDWLQRNIPTIHESYKARRSSYIS